MPMFVAENTNVEVDGDTVRAIIAGMGNFKSRALEILQKNNIKDPKAGEWYKQQDWLNAFEEISTKLGANTLFAIGSKIPEMAKFPPQIDNIEKALSAIDIAYHMNHRLNGKVLFDPDTNTIHGGIGNYTFTKTGDSAGKIICANPYPCDFDRGIIDGMARRFKPEGSLLVVVKHNDAAPCRKKGAETCEYTIKW